MPLPPAHAEAYARARPRHFFAGTLEISHPALAEPIRIVTGVDEDLMLPPSTGATPVLFRALPFSASLPEEALKDGSGDGRISIDSTHPLLRESVEALASTGTPADVTYRDYEIAFTGGVADVAAVTSYSYILEGLVTKDISLTATRAEASVNFPEDDNINVPRRIFDVATYPALHGV